MSETVKSDATVSKPNFRFFPGGTQQVQRAGKVVVLNILQDSLPVVPHDLKYIGPVQRKAFTPLSISACFTDMFSPVCSDILFGILYKQNN